MIHPGAVIREQVRDQRIEGGGAYDRRLILSVDDPIYLCLIAGDEDYEDEYVNNG